jgi:WD40 repeat protein
MCSWLAEPSSPLSPVSIFWLAGLAGTGKSTIIKTFCQRVSSDNNLLLASFFASRNSADRRDPYRILHTFAYQLATTSDRVRPHVLSALRAPQDVMQEPMHEQIERLLVEPLRKAQLSGLTVLFAIDALDECQKTAAGVEGGPLIELLAQLLQQQPVKLVVTSRQEDSIASMFRSLPHVSLRLHDIALAIVEEDIRRIFDAGFADIRRRRARDLGTDLWPTPVQLNALVHLTGPLFIYAATVLMYIDGPRFLPRNRLNQILQLGPVTFSASSTPFLQIDALYANVLKSATEEVPGRVDLELCQRIGDLLRTVVLLQEPVSVYALAHLMGIVKLDDIQQMENDVRALGSVLLISGASGSERFSEIVSIFHPSFRDFLLDQQRCLDKQFLIQPAEYHHELLRRCVKLLNTHLRHDLCCIQTPGLANAEVQNLNARLAESVPEAVRYACKYWQVHLIASDALDASVFAALLELCTDHLLHWLEVLSLLGEISSASKYLPQSIVWCQVNRFVGHVTVTHSSYQRHLMDSASMQDILILLKDIHRIVRAYAIPITSHALQVYHSVLATGSSCRLLSCVPSSQIVVPRLVSQRASDWSPALQVFEGHTNAIWSVAWSHDGLYICSGSSDRTVRVWDAQTGKKLAVLEGHGKPLRSVAFSPDGAKITSGSDDRTIRVWDTHTGKQLLLLEGHNSSVLSVAFSPNGAHIVSGSDDSTVRMWDAQTGEELAVLEGHSKCVNSVAFSPDGAQIVSGSDDKTSRMWDTHTSKQLAVFEFHSDAVLCVAFSPNGAHIASGSSDTTSRVWDAQTGNGLTVLEGHNKLVRSVAFSPDGSHIVSGTDDDTVWMWDAHRGKKLAVLQGHSAHVNSVMFSPDGAYIVSGSSDETLRVWDAQTGKELAGINGHRSYVNSVAFSHDGSYIVSGSDDSTVRLWNAQMGEELAVIEGHSGPVYSVTFSPDGEKIISGSWDRTVRMWEARTGKELAVFEGHTAWVMSVTFSPDGERIISRDSRCVEHAWNVRGAVSLSKQFMVGSPLNLPQICVVLK